MIVTVEKSSPFIFKHGSKMALKIPLMLKESIQHPYFLLGAIVIVLLISSIPFRINHYKIADTLLFFAVLLAFIDWILTLFLILRNPFLDKRAKRFWIVMASLFPPIGSMLYIAMENRKLGI